jgi:hypothetical protein
MLVGMHRFVLMAAIVTALAASASASALAVPHQVTDQASTASVAGIGIRHSFGSYSTGWGRVKPKHLYNGGDGSGSISHIRWSTWGGSVARGRGKNPIFRPRGGYYPNPAPIKLRAKDPGPCGASGRIGYHHLYFSEPRKPGGAFGRWRIWTSYHRNLCKRFQ